MAVDWLLPAIPTYVAPPVLERKPCKCPVCEGSGKVFNSTAATHTYGEQCHGCAGTGVVWPP